MLALALEVVTETASLRDFELVVVAFLTVLASYHGQTRCTLHGRRWTADESAYRRGVFERGRVSIG